MSDDRTRSRSEANGCGCKVGAVIETHGLDDADDDLIERWLGRRGDGESVRALTDRLNQRILRSAMRSGGMDTVEGEAENLYQHLTDEETLEAVRIRTRSVLTENGIDVNGIEDDFVSHQTLYRHLRNCLNVRKEPNSLSIEKERDRINSLQNRSEAVIANSVSRLSEADALEIDDFEILVNFRVSCENCGVLHDASELLDRGGCDCRS